MELLIPAEAAEGADAFDHSGRPTGLRRSAQALDAAAHATIDDPAVWCRSVREGLEQLDAAWVRHAADNESPGGFFDTLRSEAPQLDPRLRRLHRDHEDLHQAIHITLDHLTDKAPDVTTSRREVDALLVLLTRHEQRGAEVIHQAYEVDTGGGD